MRSQALIIALFVSAVPAFAQTTGQPARGNTPPGMSQDGSTPAEGAFKGGPIRPGESAGLREDCLKDEPRPATGASMPDIRRQPKEIDRLDTEKPGTK